MELLYVVLGLLVLYLFMNKCDCRIVEGAFEPNYDPISERRIIDPPYGQEGACCVWGGCNLGYECDSGGFWGEYCSGKFGKAGAVIHDGEIKGKAWGACKRSWWNRG